MRQYLQTTSQSVILTISLSIVAIVTAEIVSIVFGVLAGAVLDGLVLVGLVNLSYFIKLPEARRIIQVLILVPLMRILSFTIPVPHVAPIIWYVMIGIPLLLATFVVIYINKLPSLTHKLSGGRLVVQVLFGLIGIPIGLFAALILPATPMIIPAKSIGWILAGTIIMTIFSAVPEEIIFRGLIQKALSVSFGPLGIIITSIFYASLFLGTLNAGYVIFFGLTGLLFSLWVKFSNSLWGVILAHSLINIMFFLLLAH